MKSKRINLKKGFIEVYNFGGIKLHAYQTNDFMYDECFILENEENILLIELPAFHSNLGEFEEYVKGLNKNIVGKVFSDHPNGGASILSNVKNYASQGTINSMTSGTIKHLNEGFIPNFGADFDEKLPVITDILTENKVNIGGFELNIKYNEENIEIEFPQINSVYTHMLGHDVHSIVAGATHADGIIAQLKGYKEKGYSFVLSSHYTPETLKDVDTKIAYLEALKVIANNSKNANEFKENVKAKYPEYSGLNYLDMTANFFFPEN